MMGGGARTSNFGGFDFGGAQQRTTRTRKQPPKENLDVTMNLNVTAKDLFEQKPITVKYNQMEKCTQCPPRGFCQVCGGTGIHSEQKSIKVRIPKEVKEGQKIRVKGEGKSDAYGEKGDLYLVLHMKDNTYQMDGSDLTKEIEITPPEAVLGCKKNIDTLHGKIGIKIPPMTSSGQSLRLKGLGLPTKSGYGNLNAKIKIVIPKNLTDKEIDLYKQML